MDLRILSRMGSDRCVKGEMRHCDTPEWAPLENLLGSDELCAHFMWMFDVELEDGEIVNAYKHRWTRRYVHLDRHGRAFAYMGADCYREVDPQDAIDDAFAGWEHELEPSERAALQAVLEGVQRPSGDRRSSSSAAS